jgi:hypothetical protein
VRLVAVSDAVLKISPFVGHELRDLVSTRGSFAPDIADNLPDLKLVITHLISHRIKPGLV